MHQLILISFFFLAFIHLKGYKRFYCWSWNRWRFTQQSYSNSSWSWPLESQIQICWNVQVQSWWWCYRGYLRRLQRFSDDFVRERSRRRMIHYNHQKPPLSGHSIIACICIWWSRLCNLCWSFLFQKGSEHKIETETI